MKYSRFQKLLVSGACILFVCSCAPHIIKFSPERGAVGTEVVIEGLRFGATPADNIVKFGDVNAVISSMPATNKIITTVPPGAKTALISITVDNKTGKSDKNFIVKDSTKWTFMVYIDGDNNLEAAAIDDFLEMAQVGSNDEMEIIVQMDRRSGYNTGYNDWTDTRRFRIVKGSVPSDAPELNLGEANMGDPAVLQDFVEWGVNNYPAEHYALVIWNHGDGWRLMKQTLSDTSVLRMSRGEEETAVARAIASDDTDNDILYMREVQDALTGARDRNNTMVKLDIIGFDACLMGMVEVGYAIRNNTLFAVGSEETEPFNGWPYDEIMSDLQNNTDYTPKDLAGMIVTKYNGSYSGQSGVTQSAIEISHLSNLVSSINHFCDVANTEWNVLKTARTNSIQYHPGFYSFWGVDLWDFADQVYGNVANTNIRTAALEIKTAINQLVTNELHSGDMNGSYGIAIYFPPDKNAFDNDPDHTGYMDDNVFMPVDFVRYNKWDNWLQEFYTH
jgi:hypothetical protein